MTTKQTIITNKTIRLTAVQVKEAVKLFIINKCVPELADVEFDLDVSTDYQGLYAIVDYYD